MEIICKGRGTSREPKVLLLNSYHWHNKLSLWAQKISKRIAAVITELIPSGQKLTISTTAESPSGSMLPSKNLELYRISSVQKMFIFCILKTLSANSRPEPCKVSCTFDTFYADFRKTFRSLVQLRIWLLFQEAQLHPVSMTKLAKNASQQCSTVLNTYYFVAVCGCEHYYLLKQVAFLCWSSNLWWVYNVPLATCHIMAPYSYHYTLGNSVQSTLNFKPGCFHVWVSNYITTLSTLEWMKR